MDALDKTAWEVLNATADDWENLEQIYREVCFEFSSENYEGRDQGAYYYRPAKGAPLLSELAERLCDLAEAGLLAVRLGDSGSPVTDLNDRSYVWRAWFTMTLEGREVWAASEDAALA